MKTDEQITIGRLYGMTEDDIKLLMQIKQRQQFRPDYSDKYGYQSSYPWHWDAREEATI